MTDTELAALIKESIADLIILRWVNVKDQLPDSICSHHIRLMYPKLLVINEGMIELAFYKDEKFYKLDAIDLFYDVTHWMPIPRIPPL